MARAIVLAAGMGTRMKSKQPKVLHEICGRPMLWYTLRALRDAGVTEIVVVTNAVVESLIATMLADFGGRSVIQEPQRGTGHAVQVGLAAFAPGTAPLIVAYGDMPLVTQTIFEDVIASLTSGASALGLVTARMPLPSNFGRIVRAGEAVAKIVEARDCTPTELALNEMNAGIYAFDEPALRSVIDKLSDNNVQRELYLTDTVELLIAAGKRVAPVPVADFRLVLGVNDRVELAKARTILNERLCEAHMRSGVTIVDPATTYLEPDLSIGADSIICPNTSIGGKTTIGAGVRLGPSTRITDATIEAGAQISESVIVDSHVGPRASIGPFAHIRGGNDIGADVHIGNFVELKKTTMHAGAKAGHLAYLGDAEIGERTNIGAGTITCNYDGVSKHRTTIGKDAFIGTNSSLVAPLTIGAGALTAAGSVVTKDVEAGGRVAGVPAKPLPTKSA